MAIFPFGHHISLHHSQTSHSFVHTCEHLNTIYLYIILKQFVLMEPSYDRLNTIYLYIILKLPRTAKNSGGSLNTIYLYIILKRYSRTK